MASSSLGNGCEMEKWKRNFPNKDAFLRVNFLHQASHLLAASKDCDDHCSNILSSTAKNVAQKVVLKQDPCIRRSTCKKCNTVLLPGKTSKVRVRGGAQKHRVVTCLACGSCKKYPVGSGGKYPKQKTKKRTPDKAGDPPVPQAM